MLCYVTNIYVDLRLINAFAYLDFTLSGVDYGGLASTNNHTTSYVTEATL